VRPAWHTSCSTARNAITVALAARLGDALRAAAAWAQVIIIRGAGGHFCAGGDFHEVSRLRAEGPEAFRALFETFGAACEQLGELVPVVAAAEGYAMAGGFELIQACDIAIARDDAVLADNHLNFGMIPGGGGSQRLPLPDGLALETETIIEHLGGAGAGAGISRFTGRGRPAGGAARRGSCCSPARARTSAQAAT